MLGTIRFFLAILVVLNHSFGAVLDHIGAHAVTAFYVISGYLITRILHEVYGFRGRPLFRFLLNRFLRIYPAYWLCLGVTLLYLSIPGLPGIYSTAKIPSGFYQWIANLTFINLAWSPSIVVPVAWSLGVEFFFYFAMALGLSRSKKITMTWLGVSLLITLYLNLTNASFSDRYYTLVAASLFFSLGAGIYHFRKELVYVRLPISMVWIIFAVFCFSPLIIMGAGFDFHTAGYYIPAALFFVVISNVVRVDNKVHLLCDRALGNLSYPVYLLHYLAIGIVRSVGLTSIEPYSSGFAVAVIITTVILSMCLWHVILEPLESLRDKIRYKNNHIV